jgi:flagellar protein FlgJ
VAAGRELGVDPRSLLAHAALETAWGKSMPAAANGQGSNNLFGVKAGAHWNGDSVGSSTVEFDHGVAQQRTERFRAYDTPAASFQDYVALLRDNPRYAAALGQGSDAAGFASALQNAGYATDPRYAQKLLAVTRQVRDVVDDFLKAGSPLPIPTAGTDMTLSQRPLLQLEPIDG